MERATIVDRIHGASSGAPHRSFRVTDETRIPIVLLTGFLGAGKTTLLNRLLRHPEMSGTAVVINEYGEVGLDHHLVEQAEPDDIELIEGGCMCCTARGKLTDALMSLFVKAQRKQIPTIKRLIIETTGLAEPGPILQQINGSEQLAERFVLDSVVTLVDAVNGDATLTEIDIAQKQITAADRLLLTKTDLAEQASVDTLRAKLAAINPDAIIENVGPNGVEPGQLFSGARYRASAGAFRITGLLANADRIRLAAGPSLLAEGSDESQSPDAFQIQTFSLVFDEPLAPWRFFGWLDYLRSLCGSDLLRVKGILNIEGNPAPFVIHGVQNVFHPVEELKAWPSDDHRSRIVFITRGWGEETVKQIVGQLTGPEQPMDDAAIDAAWADA